MWTDVSLGLLALKRSWLKCLWVCSRLASITAFQASPPFKSRVIGLTMCWHFHNEEERPARPPASGKRSWFFKVWSTVESCNTCTRPTIKYWGCFRVWSRLTGCQEFFLMFPKLNQLFIFHFLKGYFMWNWNYTFLTTHPMLWWHFVVHISEFNGGKSFQ